MIPNEPLDLIDQVAADYLRDNPEVDRHRMGSPEVAAAWHITRELAASADGMLRAWRVPAVQRRQLAQHLFEQGFGTPRGRYGAELAAKLAEAERVDLAAQLAHVEADNAGLRRRMGMLVNGPMAAEAEVLGQRFRYVDRQWIEVDTPSQGE